MNTENKPQKIYGIRPVLELLESRQPVEKINFLQGIKNPGIKEIMAKCQELNIPFTYLPKKQFDREVKKNHQGVYAITSLIHFATIENVISSAFERGKEPLLLVLDKVTDVGNLGSIARTAECTGVDGIIIPSKKSAQVTEDAIRISAGALLHIPVCREKSLREALKKIKECGLQTLACTEKASKAVWDIDLKTPTALIFGSEFKGIAQEIIDDADECTKIPLAGKMESLNVATATAMILYEVSKQRNS